MSESSGSPEVKRKLPRLSTVVEKTSPRIAKKISKQEGRIDVAMVMYDSYRRLERYLQEQGKKTVPQEVLDAYEQDEDVIKGIFGRERVNPNILYHGTGAIKYAGNKYFRGVHGEEYIFPLDDIIANGLHPHFDPWILSTDHVMSTSFATSWSYAKTYADRHQYPGNPLLWENGKSSEWFGYFMTDSLMVEAGNVTRNPRALVKYVHLFKKENEITKRTDLTKTQQWMWDVNRSVSPEDPLIKILTTRTDIPGNYGGIITIDSAAVNAFNMGMGGVYEVRTKDVIKPSEFLSLSVPLEEVESMKRKAAAANLRVPIFATEAVDYHLSRFPLHELTSDLRVQNLRKKK